MSATFDLEVVDNEISLVLYSAGGAGRPGGIPRNADYAHALEILLSRLGRLHAVIKDAYVDSAAVSGLPLDERRLEVLEWPYPIHLHDVTHYDELRRSMTRAQRSIGRTTTEAAPGGNERKRIRVCVTVPDYSPTSISVQRLELILSLSQMPVSAPPGQGFSTDTALKQAVEGAAMAAAIVHFRGEGWDVEDVSLHESYDLHCTRGGETLRVEVKGSTQPCARVLLTPNEVAHALQYPDTMALFVLSSIPITVCEGVTTASGGTATIFEPWTLDPQRLTATGYSYALDG